MRYHCRDNTSVKCVTPLGFAMPSLNVSVFLRKKYLLWERLSYRNSVSGQTELNAIKLTTFFLILLILIFSILILLFLNRTVFLLFSNVIFSLVFEPNGFPLGKKTIQGTIWYDFKQHSICNNVSLWTVGPPN